MRIFQKRKMIKRLNQMVDDAMSGEFEESRYDETELSKLESKWKRYLTSSKLSRLKIEEERSNIKEIISDISHQTKTPLSNVLLYSQMLKERVEDPEQSFMVDQILTQTEKLEFLIKSMVKMSRLETNVISLHPVKQKVEPLIQKAIEEIKPKAQEKNIHIQLDSIEYGEAAYDLKWTREALFNILENAVKYSDEDTTINVSVTAFELYLVIHVKDEGIGILEEEKVEIFRRFYRGSRTVDKEGIGVGLYLAREIISLQSGYIKVENNNTKGAQFSIYLPINLSEV